MKTLSRIDEIFDAILFDWDGTLYDSMLSLAQSGVETCSRLGVEISLEFFSENYVQPWWEFYAKLGIPTHSKEDRERIYTIFHGIHDSSGRTAEVYPEVPELLADFSRNRTILGIVSAEKLEKINAALVRKDIRQFLYEENVIGNAHEKVEAIKNFCVQRSLDPKKVLMIGDLPSDLENGKNAGVKVAGVARSASAMKRLVDCKPDFLFSSLQTKEVFYPVPFEKDNI